MQNSSCRLLYGLLLMFSGFHNLEADIVTVNFQKVFESYDELKMADRMLREEVTAFQKAQQGKTEALQAGKTAFDELRKQAARPEVTDDERKEMVKTATAQLEELNRQEKEIRQERLQFQKDLEAKGLRLRRGIVDKINARIAVLADSKGWDLVLDSSGRTPAGLPVVIYAAAAVDQTDAVIEALKKPSGDISGNPVVKE